MAEAAAANDVEVLIAKLDVNLGRVNNGLSGMAVELLAWAN